jgi:hypothetical protein
MCFVERTTVVQEARKLKGGGTPLGILVATRHFYIALRRGTDTAPTAFSSTDIFDEIMWKVSPYPLCDIPGHHSVSIPHVRNLEIGESAHAPIITPLVDPCHDYVPFTPSPPARSDIPPLCTSHQGPDPPHMADEPAPGDVLSTTTASSHHAHLVPTANLITSLDLSVATATRDSGDRHPIFSSIPGSDLRPAAVAPPFIPQSDSAHLSGSAVSAQQNVDDHAVPPSTSPGMSASTPFLLLPLPGHTQLPASVCAPSAAI